MFLLQVLLLQGLLLQVLLLVLQVLFRLLQVLVYRFSIVHHPKRASAPAGWAPTFVDPARAFDVSVPPPCPELCAVLGCKRSVVLLRNQATLEPARPGGY